MKIAITIFSLLKIQTLLNKRPLPAGAGTCAQQPGAGKLGRVVEGGKLHRREG
jgi:hypothetical protein